MCRKFEFIFSNVSFSITKPQIFVAPRSCAPTAAIKHNYANGPLSRESLILKIDSLITTNELSEAPTTRSVDIHTVLTVDRLTAMGSRNVIAGRIYTSVTDKRRDGGR